jgi:hypothetical protein
MHGWQRPSSVRIEKRQPDCCQDHGGRRSSEGEKNTYRPRPTWKRRAANINTTLHYTIRPRGTRTTLASDDVSLTALRLLRGSAPSHTGSSWGSSSSLLTSCTIDQLMGSREDFPSDLRLVRCGKKTKFFEAVRIFASFHLKKIYQHAA